MATLSSPVTLERCSCPVKCDVLLLGAVGIQTPAYDCQKHIISKHRSHVTAAPSSKEQLHMHTCKDNLHTFQQYTQNRPMTSTVLYSSNSSYIQHWQGSINCIYCGYNVMILCGLTELVSLFQNIYTKPTFLCWSLPGCLSSCSFTSEIEIEIGPTLT